MKVVVNDVTSTLHLEDCTMEMEGVYECRISNKLAHDKTKASLIVSGKWNPDTFLCHP